MFPYLEFEGIKIHDWSKWEDPFRLTVDAYTKYQAEKDKRLYAVLDGFAQGQGHLSLTDANYLNAMKLFLQGVAPLEYQAHRNFAYLARHLAGPVRASRRCASRSTRCGTRRPRSTPLQLQQVLQRLPQLPRAARPGLVPLGAQVVLRRRAVGRPLRVPHRHRVLLRVPADEPARPFMSGASFNGDLPTMTFGFSAQSDESRHMTLGLEAIKFLLEQDEANVPIVQAWIDKWFWRGYRVTGLVAQMLDYMLPRKVMSWKEAFELYFEQQMMQGLFQDLAFYGITPAQARRGRHRREGDPLAPGVLDPLPVLARRGVHDERPGRRAPGVALEDLPGHLRHVLQAALGQGEAQHRGRRPALRPRPAAAVPGLPDPDGLHRAG